jgi:hypothetical protein
VKYLYLLKQLVQKLDLFIQTIGYPQQCAGILFFLLYNSHGSSSPLIHYTLLHCRFEVRTLNFSYFLFTSSPARSYTRLLQTSSSPAAASLCVRHLPPPVPPLLFPVSAWRPQSRRWRQMELARSRWSQCRLTTLWRTMCWPR